MEISISKTISVATSIELTDAQVLEIDNQFEGDVKYYVEHLARNMSIDEFTPVGEGEIEVDEIDKKEFDEKLAKARENIRNIEFYETSNIYIREYNWKSCDDFFDYEKMRKLYKFTDKEDSYRDCWSIYTSNEYMFASIRNEMIVRQKDFARCPLIESCMSAIPPVFFDHLKNNKFDIVNGRFYLRIADKMYKYKSNANISQIVNFFERDDLKSGYVKYNYGEIKFKKVYLHDKLCIIECSEGHVIVKKEYADLIKSIKFDRFFYKDNESYVVFEKDGQIVAVNYEEDMYYDTDE